MAELSVALERILTTPLPLYVFVSAMRRQTHPTFTACYPFTSGELLSLFSSFMMLTPGQAVRLGASCPRDLNLPSRSTVWIYLAFLPFQLISQFEWYTIPGVAIAAFIYLGFVAAGEEIEQPFGAFPTVSRLIAVRLPADVSTQGTTRMTSTWTCSATTSSAQTSSASGALARRTRSSAKLPRAATRAPAPAPLRVYPSFKTCLRASPPRGKRPV
jgi:hypothetical protein